MNEQCTKKYVSELYGMDICILYVKLARMCNENLRSDSLEMFMMELFHFYLKVVPSRFAKS